MVSVSVGIQYPYTLFKNQAVENNQLHDYDWKYRNIIHNKSIINWIWFDIIAGQSIVLSVALLVSFLSKLQQLFNTYNYFIQ